MKQYINLEEYRDYLTQNVLQKVKGEFEKGVYSKYLAKAVQSATLASQNHIEQIREQLATVVSESKASMETLKTENMNL